MDVFGFPRPFASMPDLFAAAEDTSTFPKSLTSATALRSDLPKIASVKRQKGFWKRFPIAPDAKSKDFEKGKDD